MDDGEFPTNDLLIDLKDRLHAGDSVGNVGTRLASSSDENENQLDGDRSEVLTSSDSAMGMHEKVEQDNINNNENVDSGDCTASCKEVETEKNSESFHMDIHREEKPVLEKWTDGKRSPTCKKDSIRKSTGVPSVDTTALKKENALLKATDSVHDEDADETNVNYQQKQQKQTLQSLFSMLREEFERMDSRILPLCLHQIAEAYFQEEEYEKAMKFIQLERLYHEQLLANLSSIQEQWETKWKTAEPSTVTTLRNSAKGLNSEELENLAKLCTSHQEPLVSKHKLVTTEKSLGGNRSVQLMGSEDLKERGAAAACGSDTETWPGIGPRKENQHRERQMSESSLCDSKTDRLTEAASLQVAAGKDHMEEQHCSAESTLKPHTQSTGTVGRPCSDCLSSGDAGKDNCLQPREKQFSKDVAKIEDVAKEPGVELSGEPMVDTLVLTDADYIPPDLISKDENVQAERNVLRSKHRAGFTETARSQSGNSALNQQQQKPGLGDEDGKSPQDRTASNICENMCYGSNKAPEHISPAHPKVCKGLQEMARQQEEEVNNDEPEDFFGRFLNGSIKDTEESLANLENQENSETLPDIPLEQASYSSTEALLDDSFSSIDELAKRIEIAEVAPAEGLVSILKKRDDSEGKTLAQIQQRNPKRRVRFQEMEDTLDQDEVGGGSCVLLILLCIATVFLSVGGTALYCTFGDMESPVCTDFAANMDFYYTQILQGVEELKHWVAFT